MRLLDVVAMRFGDRPVPAELSALIAMSSAGDSPFDLTEIEFIDPERGHHLLDNSVRDSDRANPDIMANVAAVDEVLRHAVFVASDDNHLYGYWLHPDESTEPPAIVCYSSEAQFSIVGGSLVEVWFGPDAFDDEEFARLFVDAGGAITARSLGEFAKPAVVTSPADLHLRLYRAGRAKRDLPDF
jgi:hypothetical protein